MKIVFTKVQENIERNERQILVFFAITIENITQTVKKHLKLENIATVKYEIAVFIYSQLYISGKVSSSSKFFMTSLRDHVSTIIKCKDEYFDNRVILYNKLFNEYSKDYSNKSSKSNYENKIYLTLSKLIKRALFYSEESYELNGRRYLVTEIDFPGSIENINNYENIEIPVKEINNELMNFIYDKCDNPLRLEIY
jgi:hypothetical protein